MYSWNGGAVTVEDAVPTSAPVSGDVLAQFMPSISTVTLGIVQMRDRTQYLGPLAVHTFGPPNVTTNSVTWPITGGLLSASAGGTITVESTGTELRARVEGYRPMLPRSVYEQTQLRLHHALVRVQLLRLAELIPPGEPATPSSMIAAAAIDIAACAGFSLVLARRRRIGAFLQIALAYHVVSWTTTGRTPGNRVMRQRVVSRDGSRVNLVQAALRLALPFRDDVSATTVIRDHF